MFNYNSKVVADNINEIWQQYTYKDYQQGIKWYEEANQYSLELAEKYNVTPAKAAGVLSALSPMKEWSLNKRLADEFFGFLQTAPKTGWMKVGHYLLQKRKAWKIYNNNLSVDEIGKCLHGLKTLNFFHCINNPSTTDHLCVDRHMLKIAGVETKSVTEKQYLFLKKEYLTFASSVGMNPAQAQAVLWVTYKRVKKV